MILMNNLRVSLEARALFLVSLSTPLLNGQVLAKGAVTDGQDKYEFSFSKILRERPTFKHTSISQEPVNSASKTSPLQDSIDSLVAPYLSSSSFSGDILVVQKGKVIFNKGYGLANHEHALPVRPLTKFYIASITKSFTAAAILLLQDKGKLAISDPVSRFLPDFTDGKQITIHHLLTHTSGITDSLRFPDFFELSKRPYTTEEAVNLFCKKPLMFKPGEKSSYSNSNYVLLAYIVEKVSGQTFNDFLKTNFFIPLGMKNTGQPNRPNELVPHLATGYSAVGFDEFEIARPYDRSILTGAASLYSTSADLAKWVEGLLAGRVLKKASVEKLYKGSNSYSWTLTKLWNRDVILENGWDGVGFAASIMHFIDEDMTVVVLTNLNISNVTSELANNISALMLKEKAKPLKINKALLSDDMTRKFVGRYKLGDDFYVPGTVLEIVEKCGKFYEQQRNPSRLIGLIPVANSEFIHRSSWGRIKFEINEKGEVTGLLYYGRFNAPKL
jgi:CubicO group peptidase (beta-lactamase class C family)